MTEIISSWSDDKPWDGDAGRTCPGINQGPLHSFVQIETQRLTRAPK